MSRKTLFGALLATIALLVAATTATAAERAYEPNTVIVKYSPSAGSGTVDALADRLGLGATVDRIRHSGAEVVRVGGDPAQVAQRLQRSAAVAYAEPDYVLSIAATPNDARYGELYGLNNTGQTGGLADADIDAPEGWDAAGLGAFPATGGAKVGIVDTGIQATHPDLGGKVANCAKSQGLLPVLGGSIREGSCADDNGHGTHVAGTITANANNGVGVTGVSFNSPLAICKALSSSGSGPPWARSLERPSSPSARRSARRSRRSSPGSTATASRSARSTRWPSASTRRPAST